MRLDRITTAAARWRAGTKRSAAVGRAATGLWLVLAVALTILWAGALAWLILRAGGWLGAFF